MLIRTKFTPPRPTRPPVRREKALGLLSSGLSRALTLVRAPAGFGKTSLLTAWREQMLERNIFVAWLTLDQDDNDETRFIEYLTTALAEALGSRADDTPEFANAGRIVSVRVHLTSIINALDKIEREVALIVDDYEKITDPKVHELFAFLLRHIPSNLHIFVATRSDLPIPLTSLRASDQLVEVNIETLRFGVADTQAFLAGSMSPSLSADEVRAIHDATEGWVVGLQLATLAMTGCPNVRDLISGFSRHSRVVSDYLAENVLTQIPVATLEFMIRTSILDRLNGSLCEALTGVGDAAGKLEWLVRHNMFLQPLDEEWQWFCYHGLFADFLRTQLRHRFPQECERLHLRAAQWFSEQGLWAEAVRHAMDANRSDLAAEWLERCALGELRSGRVRNLLSWIQKLPQEALTQHFSIRIAQIWALILTVQPQQARALLDEVQTQLNEAPPPDADELRCTLRAQCVSIMSMGDRIGAALELGKKVWIERFPRGVEPGRGFDWTDEAFLNAMLHLYRKSGDLDAARRVEAFYRPRQEEVQNLLMMSYRTGLISALEIRENQIRVAARRLEAALRLSETHAGRRSATATFLAALLAGVYYDWNLFESVEGLLANRCDVIDDVCFVEPTQTAYVSLARIRMATGQLDAARAILDHIEMLAERREWLGLAAASMGERIRLELLEDQDSAAERSLKRLEAMQLQMAHLDPDRVDVMLMSASARSRLLLHRHCFAEAETLLNDVLARIAEPGAAATSYEIAEIRTLLAIAHHYSGNPIAAQQCLSQVLMLTAPEGLIRPLADEGLRIVPILQACIRADAEASPRTAYYERLFVALDVESSCAESVTAGLGCLDDTQDPNSLSRRESIILELLSRNLSNKQIAKELFITPETVKWHLKNIYRKMGVSDRQSASRLGLHAHHTDDR